MSPPPLPPWAEEMRRLFRAGAASQFLLYGNVFDLVPAPDAKGGGRYVPLRTFLAEVMLEPFDVVLLYDRGRGIRVKKGGDHFEKRGQAPFFHKGACPRFSLAGWPGDGRKHPRRGRCRPSWESVEAGR